MAGRATDEDDFTAQKAAANAAFAAGNYLDACAKFSTLLEQHRDNVQLLCNRSAAFLKLRRWPEAIGDAQQALVYSLDAAPQQHIKPLYRLACALHASGNAGHAREAVLKALERGPAEAAKKQLDTLLLHCEETLRAQQPHVNFRNARVQVKVSRRREGRRRDTHATEDLKLLLPTPLPCAAPLAESAGTPVTLPPPSRDLLGHLRGALRALLQAPLAVWLLEQAKNLLTRLRFPWLSLSRPGDVVESPAASAPQCEPSRGDSALDGLVALPSDTFTPHGPPPSHLMALPSDTFRLCLDRLSLLELLHCRGVNHAWAEETRRLLPARQRLPEGTYCFAASWMESRPGAIWAEEDLANVQAAGALTLCVLLPCSCLALALLLPYFYLTLTFAGALTLCADGPEDAWSSVHGTLADESGGRSAVSEINGHYKPAGQLIMELPMRHERGRTMLVNVSVVEARVSCVEQSWTFEQPRGSSSDAAGPDNRFSIELTYLYSLDNGALGT